MTYSLLKLKSKKSKIDSRVENLMLHVKFKSKLHSKSSQMIAQLYGFPVLVLHHCHGLPVCRSLSPAGLSGHHCWKLHTTPRSST